MLETAFLHDREFIFPEQFYSFLNKYMSNFAIPPVLTADEKISR